MLLTKNIGLAWDAVQGTTHRAAIREGDSLELVRALPDSVIDLTITSPPYCMGKEYEGNESVETFIEAHELILPEIIRVTKDGGSICWQVGNYVRKNDVVPLDFLVFGMMQKYPEIKL